MSEYEFDEIVAERGLQLQTDPIKEIRVLLGKPRLVPGSSGDWVCPAKIEGFDASADIGGQDSMQALLLALKWIQTRLEVINAATEGKLRWHESKYLGFPRIGATAPPVVEDESTQHDET